MTSPKHWVIIPAAGVGARMKSNCPKQYLSLSGKTILEHTLSCFDASPYFESVFVGVSANDEYFESLKVSPSVRFFEGGSERANTVLNGLEVLSDIAGADDWVWVHDAARPCLSEQDIAQIYVSLANESNIDIEGIVLASKMTDTVKQVASGKSMLISDTLDRDLLWRAETPQVFRYQKLRSLIERALADGKMVTDEASAYEAYDYAPTLAESSSINIKVTRPSDLIVAQSLLDEKLSCASAKEEL